MEPPKARRPHANPVYRSAQRLVSSVPTPFVKPRGLRRFLTLARRSRGLLTGLALGLVAGFLLWRTTTRPGASIPTVPLLNPREDTARPLSTALRTLLPSVPATPPAAGRAPEGGPDRPAPADTTGARVATPVGALAASAGASADSALIRSPLSAQPRAGANPASPYAANCAPPAGPRSPSSFSSAKSRPPPTVTPPPA